MTHTPGPWFVENIMHGGPRIVHGEPSEAGLRDDVPFHASTEIAQGNTRIAAAAPELLDSLRAIVFQASQGKVFERDACIAQARAAIAKAEGR